MILIRRTRKGLAVLASAGVVLVAVPPRRAGRRPAPPGPTALAAAEAALRLGDAARAAQIASAALPGYARSLIAGLYRHTPHRARIAIDFLRVHLQLAEAPPAPPVPVLPPDASGGPRHRRPELLLVGGIGRLAVLYGDLADQAGFQLTYVERGSRRVARLRPAAILVVTTVVSHPLRAAAAALAAACGVPIVYLQEPSLSAIGRGIREVLAQRAAAPSEARP